MRNIPEIPPGCAPDIPRMDIRGNADLAIFLSGAQHVLAEELVLAFQEAFPEVIQVFWETLPGLLGLRQILAGGALVNGRFLGVYPDVYVAAGEQAASVLVEAGHARREDCRPFVRGRLAILVRRGNPKGVRGVEDLGREDVRVSQPDPRFEDCGHHTLAMYREAGGARLAWRIVEEKRARGTTLLTRAHHRETLPRLSLGSVDAGPVWAGEALRALASGEDVEVVEPGPDLDQRARALYFTVRLKDAPCPENARKFFEFLHCPSALTLYRQHGFLGFGD